MNEIKPFETMTYEDGDICVDDVQVTYTQNGDCTESEDEVQTLTVSSRNNGMARFINIKTENWSISDVNELIKVINDFISRASIIYEGKQK